MGLNWVRESEAKQILRDALKRPLKFKKKNGIINVFAQTPLGDWRQIARGDSWSTILVGLKDFSDEISAGLLRYLADKI
ncbi:MAG TPA: hypothetical protein PKD57_14710 [Saprospiraceae bacterium]|nr:hypothetical protein [Verrucomicrobiae bacterium]HMW40656.1 hypothetical protein [Saprospiraceae bacterium]